MRSMKLLVATALVAALVAGPVMAQDAMSGSAAPAAPAATDSTKPVKHSHKKHTGKKHSHKHSTTAAPAATPAQ